ncbi:hypothetical protein [Rhodovulum sp. P5]|nr:hypothetical protein [Rhodovulum sp. P5]
MNWILIGGEVLIVLMVVRWFLSNDDDVPKDAPPTEIVQPQPDG